MQNINYYKSWRWYGDIADSVAALQLQGPSSIDPELGLLSVWSFWAWNMGFL